MKKSLSIIAIFFSLTAFAQENGVYHGFRFGAMDDATLYNVELGDGVKAGIAAHMGYVCNIQLLRWVGFDLGLHGATRNAKITGTVFDPEWNKNFDYNTQIDQWTLNAPALFKVRFGKGTGKLKLFTGASFNYIISVKQSRKYFTLEYHDQYSYEDRKIYSQEILEIDYVGGAGFEFPIYADGIISFDYRYHYTIKPFGQIEGGVDPSRFSGSVISMSLMYKPKKEKK